MYKFQGLLLYSPHASNMITSRLYCHSLTRLSPWKSLRTLQRGTRRHMGSNINLVNEGDAVYLKPRTSLALARDCIYIPRVEAKGRIHNHKGFIESEKLIGSRVRDILTSSKGVEYLVTFPTLEEYIIYSARVVTPIYPADAAAIVNTLDLHVSPNLDPDSGPVEVLEAGTGHGSLTLHLARAIHAGYAGKEIPSAIVHTVEKERHVARAAEKLLNGFRRRIYSGKGIQFYHADVESWLKHQLTLRKQGKSAHEIISAADDGEETTEHGGARLEGTSTSEIQNELLVDGDYHSFLTACVLDMPDPRPVLPLLSQAMHAGAIVGYWAPSITQIVSVVQYIKLQRSPFYVEKVLEFANGTGGARIWDVRLAKVRSRVRAATMPPSSKEQGIGPRSDGEDSKQDGEMGREPEINTPGGPIVGEDAKGTLSEWETVCRPKAGERAQGGGFYLILRRIGQQGTVFEGTEAGKVEAPNEDRLSPTEDKQEGATAANDTI